MAEDEGEDGEAANVNITLNVYGHVLPGMQEEATERLEKLIFGARRTIGAQSARWRWQ
jgi:hypothetical protein